MRETTKQSNVTEIKTPTDTIRLPFLQPNRERSWTHAFLLRPFISHLSLPVAEEPWSVGRALQYHSLGMSALELEASFPAPVDIQALGLIELAC